MTAPSRVILPGDPHPFGPGRWDAALVYMAPPAVTRFMADLRAHAEAAGAIGTALEPHLTVLYLGRGGRDLEHVAWAVLRALANQKPVLAALTRIDTFDANGAPINLHIRALRGRGLSNAHLRAQRACAALGRRPQTPYQRTRYAPHLSILDRLARGFALPKISSVRMPARLTQPALMIRRAPFTSAG